MYTYVGVTVMCAMWYVSSQDKHFVHAHLDREQAQLRLH